MMREPPRGAGLDAWLSYLERIHPRTIDLENTERLKSFERTLVVESLAELEIAVRRRQAELAGHG